MRDQMKSVRNEKPVKSGLSFFLLPSSFFLLDERVCFLSLATKEEGRRKREEYSSAFRTLFNQIRFIIAAILLTVITAVTFAQVPSQVIDQVPDDLLPAIGPPNVTVTEVKNLGADGNDLRMRVKWNAQIPNTTKIENFRVVLTVNYASGAPANLNRTMLASAREAILPAPNRGASNQPHSFTAIIETFFTGIAVQTKTMTGNFALNQSNNFSDGVKSDASGERVHRVEAANDGSDLSRFDVFWSTGKLPKAETRFSVKGDFVYQLFQSGTPPTLPRINRSATLTAPGDARQVQFHFPSTPKLTSGQRLTGITATIAVTTIVKLTQRKDSALFTGKF